MENESHTNTSGTLKVYREKYRQPHKKAGEYNPVWKARIRLRKGGKLTKFNTKTKHRELAIREAQKKLDQMIAMDALGMPTTPLTFGELARRYMLSLHSDLRRNECSEEKYDMHQRAIDNFFNPVFERDEIGKITSGRLNKLFFDIETTPIQATKVYNGTRKIKYPNELYSASYVNKLKQVMRAILRFANKQDLTFTVPEIPSTRVPQKLKKGLSREQWDNPLNTFIRGSSQSWIKNLQTRLDQNTTDKPLSIISPSSYGRG